MKEAEHKPAERWPVFMDVFYQDCPDDHTIQRDVHIQCKSYPNTNGIPHRTREKQL